MMKPLRPRDEMVYGYGQLTKHDSSNALINGCFNTDTYETSQSPSQNDWNDWGIID